MSITTIIILIVIGFILFLIELLVIPGITIAGVMALLFVAAGIFFGYYSHGGRTGTYILLGSAVTGALFIVGALKIKTWQRFGLKSEIDGRVGTIDQDLIHKGDTGKTISRLAPIGKAMINDIIYEVRSEGGYIDSGTAIKVIRIEGNKIFVEN